MTVEKTTPTKLQHNRRGYTTLITDVINSLQSAEALAIWTYLQAKPTDWVVRKTDIMKKLALGRDRYTHGMNELKGMGLIVVMTEREPDGRILGRTLNCYSEPTEVYEISTSVKQQEIEIVDNSVDNPVHNPSTEVQVSRSVGKPTVRETSTYTDNILLTNKETNKKGFTQGKKNTDQPQKLELKSESEWAEWFEKKKGFPDKAARSIKSMMMYRRLEEGRVPFHIVRAAIKKAHAKLGRNPDQPIYYQSFIDSAFGEFKKSYVAPARPSQWHDDEDAVMREGQNRGLEFDPRKLFHEYKDMVIESVESEPQKIAEG